MSSVPCRSSVMLAFAIGGLFSPALQAQQKDAGLWTSIGLEVKVAKKLKALVCQEVRFKENITELGTYITDAGLDYKINKYLQVAVNYRFMQNRRVDDFYSPRHRFYVDLKLQKKFKPFDLHFRTRLQDEYADIGRASDGGIAEYYSRNKFSLKLDIDKPIKPYLSLELFSPLNYPCTYTFDNIRCSLGVEYALFKHHNFDLFYMIQKELQVSDPVTDFIIGMGYLYKF